MDGQALDIADVSFDAAFSMFGIFLFPDWRAGLLELARVVRPSGVAVISSWRHRQGAGPNLLPSSALAKLYPDLIIPLMPDGIEELSEPDRLEAAMVGVGFAYVAITPVTRDFVLEPSMLNQPEQVFGFSPFWKALDPNPQAGVVDEVRARTECDGLRIASTASIATGRR